MTTSTSIASSCRAEPLPSCPGSLNLSSSTFVVESQQIRITTSGNISKRTQLLFTTLHIRLIEPASHVCVHMYAKIVSHLHMSCTQATNATPRAYSTVHTEARDPLCSIGLYLSPPAGLSQRAQEADRAVEGTALGFIGNNLCRPQNESEQFFTSKHLELAVSHYTLGCRHVRASADLFTRPVHCASSWSGPSADSRSTTNHLTEST